MHSSDDGDSTPILSTNSNNNNNSATAAGRKNLNMMSAFTHIMGDTIRTIAMFVAALVATITGIDGDICDAWAALLVTVTIFILCAALVVDIYIAATDIWYDEFAAFTATSRTQSSSRSGGSISGLGGRGGSGSGSSFGLGMSSSGGGGNNNSSAGVAAVYSRLSDVEDDIDNEVNSGSGGSSRLERFDSVELNSPVYNTLK